MDGVQPSRTLGAWKFFPGFAGLIGGKFFPIDRLQFKGVATGRLWTCYIACTLMARTPCFS